MRVNIWIPDGKYDILKEIAEYRNVSLSSLLVKSALESRNVNVDHNVHE